jgi:hypothetical protein
MLIEPIFLPELVFFTEEQSVSNFFPSQLIVLLPSLLSFDLSFLCKKSLAVVELPQHIQ